MFRKALVTGFSLIELIVVLVLLTALAAIVVPLFDIEINGKSPEQIATEKTLIELSNRLLGSDTGPGLWQDLGQRLDRLEHMSQVGTLGADDPDGVVLEQMSFTFSELSAANPDLVTNTSVSAFDPTTNIGWRGPYLRNVGSKAQLDGWGNPISMQVEFYGDSSQLSNDDFRYIRLVSRGPNGALDVSLDVLSTENFKPENLGPAQRGDDIVFYLRSPDPRQNQQGVIE